MTIMAQLNLMRDVDARHVGTQEVARPLQSSRQGVEIASGPPVALSAHATRCRTC